MYESVFGFSERPFTTTPFVKHYFPARAIAQAYAQSKMCIDRASGPVIIVGDAGTGKTLLLNLIANHYQDQFNVVNLACARLDQRSDLLQSILFELQQPYRGMSEGELRLALIDFLKPGQSSPNGVLLLIDEAHSLSFGLLDEVRLITNLVRDGQPRVRLVVAGNHRVEEQLIDPKLESFNQRIGARCYLENLNYEETQLYIQAHIQRAGGKPDRMLTDEAYQAVFEVSDGCPRLINQLCEHSFMIAATRGAIPLAEDDIKEAWKDLQSIPGNWDGLLAPKTTGAHHNEPWTVLEFGSLDEGNPIETCSPETTASDIAIMDKREKSPECESGFEVAEICDESTDWVESNEQAGEFETCEMQDDLSREVYQLEEMTFQSSEFESNLASPTDEIDLVFDLDSNSEESLSLGDAEMMPITEQEDVISEIESSRSGGFQVLPDEDVDSTTGFDTSVPQTIDTADASEAENPFAEEYEEEEFLIDRYVPFVAQQNRSSLSVTSSELQSICPPQKNISFEQFQADLLGDSVNTDGADDEGGQRQPRESTQADDYNEDEQLSSSGSVDAYVSPFDEDFTPAENSPLTKINREDRRIHEYEIIHQRAMDALSSLSAYPENSVNRADPKQDLNDEISVVAYQTKKTSGAGEEFDSDDPKLILTELENQRILLSSMLNESSQGSYRMDDDAAESLSIEYPVTQHRQYRNESQDEVHGDDRDMIIVSRAEQLSRKPRAEDDSSDLDQSPPSTGRAVRMNYQQLFEQLRQLPEDE